MRRPVQRGGASALPQVQGSSVEAENERSELGPYAALRHGNYRCLLAAGVLSAVGMTSQTVAVGWEMYQRTESAWMLGLTGLAQFLPVLLLALPAGQAADRHSRKVLYQGAQFLSALASLALAGFSYAGASVWLTLGCLLIAGVARAFTAPARASLLPQVVPLPLVPNAVAWNTTGWQFANISGPVLGGLLVARYPDSPWVAYLVTAGCSLSCVLLLVPIRPAAPVLRQTTGRLLGGLAEGLRFVWRTEVMLAAITLDLFAVLLGGATALLPIFASENYLDVGAVGLGWLRAAPAIGALITAISLAHLPPLRRPGVAMLLAVAAFGAATVVFGLSRSFPLSFVMLLFTGAFDNISVVVRHTLMQVLTPDEMRGRVAAVNTVFISSSNELGEFESGATAAWWGPVRSVVVGGAGTMLVVLLVLLRWPGLLKLAPLHTLRPYPLTPQPPLPPRGEGESEYTARSAGEGIIRGEEVTGTQEGSPKG
jgi:MFS family permease